MLSNLHNTSGQLPQDNAHQKLLCVVGFWCHLGLHATRRPRQEKYGLLTLVGVGSCFRLAVPLQSNVPSVLLRAVGVVVVLFVLLQEVTLIVQHLLRQEKRGKIGFYRVLIIHV